MVHPGDQAPVGDPVADRAGPRASDPTHREPSISSATVRRAVEFIDRHAGDAIGLEDIAAAAGVGTRWLQAVFRRQWTATPTSYLRSTRLSRAHQDLLDADSSRGDTVAAIAARWRFGHAGRFAAAYLERYGRHPSTTLHHPRVPGREDGVGAAPPAGGVEVALLDGDGVIMWVNRAWNAFCVAHGGDPSRSGVGRSYLAVCEAAADDPASVAVAAAIRAAVRGELPAPTRIVVPCATPTRPLVFDVLVSTRRHDDGHVLGATLTLSETATGAPTDTS